MKKIIISIAILFFFCKNSFGQNFKQFIPKEEPFKIFERPIIKFDSSTFLPYKNYFSETENKVFNKNNLMPILKYKGNEREMLMMEPDKNIEFKMLVKKIELKTDDK